MITNVLQPPPSLVRLLKKPDLVRFDAFAYLVWQIIKNLSAGINVSPIRASFSATAVDVTISTDILKVTGPATITLPSAIGIAGAIYRVDNAYALAIVLVPIEGETIDNGTSKAVPAGSFVVVYSDGTNWRLT